MKGIGASPGIAIGEVIVKRTQEITIGKRKIENIDKEIQRLNEAREKSRKEIEALYQQTLKSMGEKEASIFNAHLMILDDPEVLGQVENEIKGNRLNTEWALKEVTDRFISIFESIEDEYLKERVSDLKDVTSRIQKILLGIGTTDFSNLQHEAIIVAEDITPSDTAQMDKRRVLGFITEVGGRTSHSAIMARTMEIPAVVGVENITSKVKDGDIIILDGEEGHIIINPDKALLDAYMKKKKEYDAFNMEVSKLKGEKTITKDGFEVELVANIGTPKDLEGVLKNAAEGVGLYRTEFLYMDRDKLPTEEEQFDAYKTVAEGLKGMPVIIRTLDIGGDKDLPYLQLPKEMNPFLGYRAIRLCLDKVDIFKTQLRALLRASAYGNIKIMFPMISSIEELREAKGILEEVKEELRTKDICFNQELEVGIMVEIPSVAVMADTFAKEVDFFSIGTNDLIQYTVAVDRGSSKISHLYNHFHPAVLRLIKQVIDSGHKEGIWVGMCGEAAGDPKLIPILIGMSLEEFSMSPSSILRSRWIINNITQEKMKILADEVINLSSSKEVESYIDKYIKF